jgi:uncharacterized membrane protein YccC
VAARLDADAGIPGTAHARNRSAASRVMDQLRLRLTLESALLRNGLRLAAGLAAARAVAGAFDLQHGFWVVFATLTVTRASARGTWADAGRAVVGTAIGAVLATALLFAFEAEADVYVALLPLFAFLAVYGGAVAFVLGQIGFTLLIVAIFNLAGPRQWDIALIRLEDVAVGAAVGVAIGVAAWPRGPGGQLRRALAHAIDAGAGYARAVASALLDPGAAETAPARRDAVWAARRAEDVFVAYLDEVVDRPAAIERWSALLERAQRLWYEASIVEENPRPETHECPRLAAALQHAVDQVAVELHAAGDALRRRTSPGSAPALLPAGGDLGRHALACAAERGRLPGIVDLLGVRAWIAELGRDLDHLRSVVGALAEPAARAAVR